MNAALDLLRARQSAAQVPLEGLEPILTDQNSPTPDRLQAGREIRAWLRQAVSRLSPTAAEMFALRFFEGKENGEIAAILKASSPGPNDQMVPPDHAAIAATMLRHGLTPAP